MEIFDKMFGFIQSIPKPIIIAVVILALLGIFLIWRKRSKKDSEDEVGEYVRTNVNELAQERKPLLASADVVSPDETEEKDDDSVLDELDDELEDVE